MDRRALLAMATALVVLLAVVAFGLFRNGFGPQDGRADSALRSGTHAPVHAV